MWPEKSSGDGVLSGRKRSYRWNRGFVRLAAEHPRTPFGHTRCIGGERAMRRLSRRAGYSPATVMRSMSTEPVR